MLAGQQALDETLVEGVWAIILCLSLSFSRPAFMMAPFLPCASLFALLPLHGSTRCSKTNQSIPEQCRINWSLGITLPRGTTSQDITCSITCADRQYEKGTMLFQNISIVSLCNVYTANGVPLREPSVRISCLISHIYTWASKYISMCVYMCIYVYVHVNNYQEKKKKGKNLVGFVFPFFTRHHHPAQSPCQCPHTAPATPPTQAHSYPPPPTS